MQTVTLRRAACSANGRQRARFTASRPAQSFAPSLPPKTRTQGAPRSAANSTHCRARSAFSGAEAGSANRQEVAMQDN